MSTDKPVAVVTGSSGLIGYEVSERLIEEFHVMGFDRPGVPHPPPDAENIPFDLTSDESIRDAFDVVRRQYGNRIATVIHLAAYYDFSGKSSPLYDQVTVQGTRRLLYALRSFEVEQFIFSSTMLVHAPCQPGQKITEDWPLEPKWEYPQSKVTTEQLIRDARCSINAVMLRIAGVYNDMCHSIPIAQQIKRIYERQMLSHVFPGDTSHGQAFVHLDDTVDSILHTVRHRRELPAEVPILIGEPETLSYEEIQKQLGRLIHGEDWNTVQIPKAMAKAGAWVQDKLPLGEEPFIKPWMIDLADDHYELDITRARQLIHWEPRHNLRDALPLMVEALKRDPVRFYEENNLDPSPPRSTGG
ncbi:MAG TPA: NAD(P)-dependent oxidoreductase [Tepidisphaeraceae bacterium]|nr:NAD(P)-dependent oxidoreductase [Tepidisphaeraceae bacterium]